MGTVVNAMYLLWNLPDGNTDVDPDFPKKFHMSTEMYKIKTG
jgi:hypothetical protein